MLCSSAVQRNMTPAAAFVPRSYGAVKSHRENKVRA